MIVISWIKKKIKGIGEKIVIGIIKRKLEKMEFLKGYKTYWVALGIGAATAALQMGWIDESTYKWIMTFLVPGGVMAMRAGMKK